MDTVIYSDIEEVADQIKEFAPPLVYKYRGWKEENHRRMLTHQETWFSHPHNLNDPLDCRPAFIYNEDEVQTQQFFDRLVANGADIYPGWSREKLYRESVLQWERIKKDPTAHFDANRKLTETYEKLEPIGVFSVGADGMNEGLWQLYADHFTGYNIGFTTIELCRDMNCTVSMVEYSDEPYLFTFSDKDRLKIYLLKTTKWAYENEFRFIMFTIGSGGERLRIFRPSTVAEITIGHNMPESDKKDLLSIAEKIYPGTPVYQTVVTDDGLQRVKIN